MRLPISIPHSLMASDAGSVTTETLSDFEGVASEGRSKLTAGNIREGSPSDSRGDQDVDSEATVTDPDPWESDQDMDMASSWQPAQRLTARQLARQERLLQGIHQTQWNDIHLPRGLDLRNKARQKEVVSEEQHLRRVKAAEVRRVQTQKAKRDTMEITKARIRAATSNKFRDMVGNAQTEKRDERKHEKLIRGRIRYRHRPGSSVLILPEDSDVPDAIAHRSASNYRPSTSLPLRPSSIESFFHVREQTDYLLGEDFSRDVLKLGQSIIVRRSEEHVSAFLEGRYLGRLVPTDLSSTDAFPESVASVLTSIRRTKLSPMPQSITLTTKSNQPMAQ